MDRSIADLSAFVLADLSAFILAEIPPSGGGAAGNFKKRAPNEPHIETGN